MKFCAVICEYNPFHNGHRYQFSEISEKSGCDRILCLMSGNFTQRGEAAVFDKYTRARHAVLCGADAVLELPAAFATAPAELFAGGAVHILSSVPAVEKLAFGCESGEKAEFLRAAEAASREDRQFRSALKERMKDGTSYARARTELLLSLNTDVDESLLTSPNNILGVEYCRAILQERANIEPLPILRRGSGYADTDLIKNFSSATALRAALTSDGRKTRKAVKDNLPDCVFEDVQSYAPLPFGQAALCALFSATAEEIAETPDCSEGLENRLVGMARTNPTYEELLKKVVSRRYTRARLQRILVQNFLKIKRKDVRDFLDSPLYLRPLAIKKSCAEEVLSALSQAEFPLLVRRSDADALKKDAPRCLAIDLRANDLYSALSGTYRSPFELQLV